MEAGSQIDGYNQSTLIGKRSDTVDSTVFLKPRKHSLGPPIVLRLLTVRFPCLEIFSPTRRTTCIVRGHSNVTGSIIHNGPSDSIRFQMTIYAPEVLRSVESSEVETQTASGPNFPCGLSFKWGMGLIPRKGHGASRMKDSAFPAMSFTIPISSQGEQSSPIGYRK